MKIPLEIEERVFRDAWRRVTRHGKTISDQSYIGFKRAICDVAKVVLAIERGDIEDAIGKIEQKEPGWCFKQAIEQARKLVRERE